MSEKPWQVIVGKKVGEKTFWNRIGAAWKRDDGGFSIQLDALPMDGKMLIAPPREAQEQGSAPRPGNRVARRDDDIPF